MPKNIVWTAVASTAAGIGSLVAAVLGNLEMTISFGFISAAAAMLAVRER